MFAVYLRAALSIPLAVLFGWLIEWIVPGFLLPLYASEDTRLYAVLSTVSENAIFLFLIGIGTATIVWATRESRVGGVR